MRRIQIIISIFVFLFSIVSHAQTLDNRERRIMNSCILSLVEEYEQYSSLYDEEAQYYFESLFENDGTPMIFCDMMGMPSYLQDIPVTEYVQLMVKQSQNTTVIIKDVQKGKATFRNGEWFVPVFFRKSISYIDQGGYVFSVNDYYDTDFDMVMNLRYDPDAGRCFIRSITGSLTADKEFPKGRFMIIDKSSEEGFQYARYMESLTVGGKALDYNEFGQAMFSYGEAQVDDPDVEVHPETRFEGYNYDVVSFRFTPRNTRVRLRYGYAPFAYSLEGLGNDVNHQSNAMEIGTDIGIAFRSGARSKMSLNIGLGISMSNLSLSYSPMYPRVYTYKFLQSPQNGIYSVGTVDYEVKSASEAMRYIDVFVPVYFEVEHNVDPRVIISWNMGFKGYYGLSASVVNPYEIKATASINGAQPKPVTLMSTNGEGTSFIEANTYAKNDFEVAAMVNLGLDINVYKKKLYAMLRVGYEYGLSSYLSTTNKYMSGRPLVYDPVSAQHIAVNSMISGISFNRSSLWISAGIKFKM